MNRFESLDFGDNPQRNMRLLLSSMVPARIVPQANKYYTFMYRAKTKGITYDQNPLIICGDIFEWGFTGLNLHWGSIRRYNFGEVVSNLFELNEAEFDTLKNIPLAVYKQS